ncbi:unnamed protein product [Chilo suppressalis]|uniref:C2H2-type domain-containing protein n=1 Tax=Chilo suppressalis TaxID=168631 RepID=A0ABN8L8P5_CHISP|nr:unnamed protein product [Chilo suppressalis]
MTSKFNKNGVFTGPVDSYCLICETYFKDANDTSAHIEKPVHLKNLEATPYYDKYKDEHIRKVKSGYYCEFCNRLLATVAKVVLHISDPQHRHSRGLQLLKRKFGGVLAFGNILINEKAWNGIIDKTCSLCNTEFEDENIHKSSGSHALNLIKINVEFQKTSIYRKIDEESFHCLTCNEVVAIKSFTEHFESLNHNKKHRECNDFGTKLASKLESVQVKQESKDAKKVIPLTETKANFTIDETPKNRKELDAFILDSLGIKDYMKELHDGQNYCLVCEGIIQRSEINNHCNSGHHLTILKMHKDKLEKKCKAENDQTKNMPSDYLKSPEIEINRNKILDSLPEFQRNDVNIDYVNDTIVCKKCSKDLDFDYDVIKNHIEGHNIETNKKVAKEIPVCAQKGANNVKKSQPVLVKDNKSDQTQTSGKSSLSFKDDEEIEVFANNNNMQYNNLKVYCNCCQTHLPASIKNLKQHVDGANHKYKQASIDKVVKMKKRDLKKVPLFLFTTSIVDLVSNVFEDVVLNKKLCVNKMSYFFLMPIGDNHVKCVCCGGVRLPLDDITPNHLLTSSHAKAFSESLVVEIDSEFIREVPKGVYHCGYCNMVESSWERMEQHLDTVQHKEHKGVAQYRLQSNIPAVNKHENREQMEFFDFLKMIHRCNSMS